MLEIGSGKGPPRGKTRDGVEGVSLVIARADKTHCALSEKFYLLKAQRWQSEEIKCITHCHEQKGVDQQKIRNVL
jgi:hypothetical protein